MASVPLALSSRTSSGIALAPRRLHLARHGRTMVGRVLAPPPASALPHYNNLARSIEAQILYRAWLGWPAAGPSAICSSCASKRVSRSSACSSRCMKSSMIGGVLMLDAGT